MIIGIDPGRQGGAAALNGFGEFVDGIRTPLIKHGRREVVDTRSLTRWCPVSKPTAIVIEQVSAMPGQGVTSMFNFGRHMGAVEGWALDWGVPIKWVTPAVWKKHYGLGKEKKASLDRARLEFGDNKLWGVLANDGIAEAALIAKWYRESSR